MTAKNALIGRTGIIDTVDSGMFKLKSPVHPAAGHGVKGVGNPICGGQSNDVWSWLFPRFPQMARMGNQARKPRHFSTMNGTLDLGAPCSSVRFSPTL